MKKHACLVTGGTGLWNVAGILGIMDVRIMISKFTLRLKERSCRFAGDAGADWLIKT